MLKELRKILEVMMLARINNKLKENCFPKQQYFPTYIKVYDIETQIHRI